MLGVSWKDVLFDRYHRLDNKHDGVLDVLFGNGVDELGGFDLGWHNVVMLRSVLNWIPRELRIIISSGLGRLFQHVLY